MSRFPDCTIFDMPQRSDAWHAMRADKLTGSQVGSWIAERPKVRLTVAELTEILTRDGIEIPKKARRDDLIAILPYPELYLALTDKAQKSKEHAIAKCLGAMSKCEVPDEWEVDPEGPPPRSPGLWAIWNGIRLEGEAEAAFAKATGRQIEKVGFCRHKLGSSGVSPDGLIAGEPDGFEGKAPLPSTHILYLRRNVLPPEYVEQVHFSMAVTGARGWWFQSYCPGLPDFRIYTPRDQFTELVALGIREFHAELEEWRLDMKKRWEESRTKESAA